MICGVIAAGRSAVVVVAQNTVVVLPALVQPEHPDALQACTACR